MKLKTADVFGISNIVSQYSYVDRGSLDAEIRTHLGRPTHIAINGASKVGKTWLRQAMIPEAIVIQCRLGKSITDIYREILAELGVRLEISTKGTYSFSGAVESSTDFGAKLIARVSAKLNLGVTRSKETQSQSLRQPIEDIGFIAKLIIEANRRVVVEDFHYLSRDERQKFAFDLKALWDQGLFVIIIGVWSESNLLLDLNHDLTGRVREASVLWARKELREILNKGSKALNLEISEAVAEKLVENSYQNAGILQRLTLEMLDKAGIYEGASKLRVIDNSQFVDDAALFYAEELNTTYQTFARNVASGVRTYPNSTGIYGHAMAVIFESSDLELINGVDIDTIFRKSHDRQPRIQKGNLRTVLEKFEQLQVDNDGRGLVLSYADDKVRAVDRQLLLYRKYSTVRWPWEDLIEQGGDTDEAYRAPA